MSLRNTIKSIKRPDPVKVKYSVYGLLENTSSIHGFKYIGDVKSPKTTRTFWICAFLLSIIGCAYYATLIYEKWYVTPDIGLKVQFNASNKVPFPAVTVCPQSKIKASLLDYDKALLSAVRDNSYHNLDDSEIQMFEMAIQMCTPGHFLLVNKTLRNDPKLKGHDYVDLMSESQFAVNETLLGLQYRLKALNANFDKYFSRVLTSDGFCFTYNLQDYSVLFKGNAGLSRDFDSYQNNRTSHWNPIDGYVNDDIDVYPTRIYSGKKNILFMILALNQHDIQETCAGADKGFKIYFHMPNEIPSYMHRSLVVGPQRTRHLILKATQMRTSEDLLRYEASQRRCYFDSERELRYFKSYTKSHCDMECLANYTLSVCGCVKFFMPRSSDTDICDFSQLECAETASDQWLENDQYYKHNSMPCNCYPSCSQIKYDIISDSDSDFSSSPVIAAFNESAEFRHDFPTGLISRFSIEFEDFLMEAHENYLGYKMQHFISDCGGLLGLFMGCSLLSLVEILFNLFTTLFKSNPIDAIKNRESMQPQIRKAYEDGGAIDIEQNE